MDDQLLSEFLAEAEELIEELYGDIAALRSRRTDGRARRELVGRLFRRVHTVKGTASAAGLEATSGLAHEFETLLDAVRLGRIALDEDALDAAEESIEAIAASLSAVARGEREGVPPSLIKRLRSLASTANATTQTSHTEAEELLPAEVARTLGEYERARLSEAVREGARAYVVAADFDLETFDEQFRRLSDALGETGEVVLAQPRVDADAPERVSFQIVYASAEEHGRLTARVAELGARLSEVEGARVSDDESVASDDEVSDVETTRRDAQDDTPQPSASPLTTHVRVPLEVLDDLISTAHEAFVDANVALEIALARESGDERRTELEERAAEARRRFFELEEHLIGLRMVEARATLERAVRAGRSVARTSGKQVEFEIAGGDVRLDKSLADLVADPLLHLLRNAVGHGIETAEERRAAGKSGRGRVRLEAVAEGSRVTLRVSDDGRGIDAELISDAAAERGLVAAGERITDAQALRLIFRPGFSTTARASFVSGRGVGLEVVERAVEEAGGEVRVRSERGRGTTFEIHMPTTLALLPVIVVRSAGQSFCVDAGRVVETFDDERTAVADVGETRTLRWRGRELPLVRLHELLGQTRDEGGADEETRAAVVVVRARSDDGSDDEARHAAVVVDSLEGRSEVLVRGLGRHAKRWRGVSGAAEMRDGTVALVLDLPLLLESKI